MYIDFDLYLEHAERTGYCIMNELDFVILPWEVYKKIIEIDVVPEILNNYYKENNRK